MKLVSRHVASIILAAGLPSIALGQVCGVLLHDTVIPGDTNGIRSNIVYDFDAEGPLPPEFLIGMDGGRVLAWDGTRWRQVGNRLSTPTGISSWGSGDLNPVVLDLVVFRGDLYAVASGTASSSQGAMFRFNGTDWDAISPVSNCSTGGTVGGWFKAAAVQGDRIIISGQALSCGGPSTTALAFDGSSYTGTGGTGVFPPRVANDALTTSDGRLLLAGSFQLSNGIFGVVELVGSTWVGRFPASTSALTGRLSEINGRVHLFGNYFSTTLGQVQVVREEADGSWSLVFPLPGEGGILDTAEGMLVRSNDTLFAGTIGSSPGRFARRANAGGTSLLDLTPSPAPFRGGIATFNGRTWLLSTLGSGGSGLTGVPFARYSDDGGQTWTLEPDRGAAQSPDNEPFTLVSIARWNDQLVLSGTMNLYTGVGSQLAPTNTPALVGNRFVASAVNLNTVPRDLVRLGDDLIAVGPFTGGSSGTIRPGTARWTGTAWEAWPALAPAGTVQAGVEFGGSLVVASQNSGITTVQRWNGSAWEVLGTISGSQGLPRLAVAAGELFVAQLNTRFVHRYDGTTFVRLGTDVDTPIITAIAPSQAEILVAGTDRVTRWTGLAWQALGAFPGSGIRSIANHQGTLYAGLNYIGAPNLAPLMRWDGTNWTPAISNLPPRAGVAHPISTISSMVSDGDILHLVGQFDYLGRLSYDSWARFSTQAPQIAIQPQDAAARVGTRARISVRLTRPEDPSVSYRWRRDGVELSNGVTPQGSVISGATSPFLAISLATPQDGGVYDVTIASPCGSTLESTPATLQIICPSDWDANGEVEPVDIRSFLDDYRAGEGDFDGNGETEPVDIRFFFDAYRAGC